MRFDPHQTVNTQPGFGLTRGPSGWRVGTYAVCSYAIGAWFEHMADVAGHRPVNVFLVDRAQRARVVGVL